MLVYGDTLYSGNALNTGQWLASNNGIYGIKMKNDGNMILYKGNIKLWASNTNGYRNGPFQLRMQTDNHLVLWDVSCNAIWATHGYLHGDNDWKRGAYAIIQNDGNFVVYDGNDKIMWSTNTVGGNISNIWIQDNFNSGKFYDVGIMHRFCIRLLNNVCVRAFCLCIRSCQFIIYIF